MDAETITSKECTNQEPLKIGVEMKTLTMRGLDLTSNRAPK